MRIQPNYAKLNHSKVNYNQQYQEQNPQKDVNFKGGTDPKPEQPPKVKELTELEKFEIYAQRLKAIENKGNMSIALRRITGLVKALFWGGAITGGLGVGGWWFVDGCDKHQKNKVEDIRTEYLNKHLKEDSMRLIGQLDAAQFEGTALKKKIDVLNSDAHNTIEANKNRKPPYVIVSSTTLEFPVFSSDKEVQNGIGKHLKSIFDSVARYTNNKIIATIEPNYSKEIKKVLNERSIRYNKRFDSIFVDADTKIKIRNRSRSLQTIENNEEALSKGHKSHFEINRDYKYFDVKVLIRKAEKNALKSKSTKVVKGALRRR